MATPPTFTAGNVLTAAQMNKIGLWAVSTITAGGTSTTLQVNNCFTSDFRHYRIYISGSSATAGNLALQLSAAGVAATTSYVWNQVLRDYSGTTNTVTSSGGSTTSMRIGLLNTGSLLATSSIVMDVTDPQISYPTGFFCHNSYSSTAGYSIVGSHYTGTSYDGFKLTGAGNLTINVEIFGFNGV